MTSLFDRIELTPTHEGRSRIAEVPLTSEQVAVTGRFYCDTGGWESGQVIVIAGEDEVVQGLI